MVITAYDDVVAAGWGPSAGAVYEPLAEALVAACPVDLDGSRVLDAGSGTGVAAAAATRRGAAVVAADLSSAMLAASVAAEEPSAAVVADVVALPFRAATFDAALAAFLLNHLDPELALRELGRVVRPHGALLASTWANGADPVKAVADDVLRAHGWRPPTWYQEMKSERQALSGDPDRLAARAVTAGLVEVAAWVHGADVAVRDPRDFAAYRVAVPHVAWWWATLGGDQRERLTADLCEAVTPLLAGWRPEVVFLQARVGGART